MSASAPQKPYKEACSYAGIVFSGAKELYPLCAICFISGESSASFPLLIQNLHSPQMIKP